MGLRNIGEERMMIEKLERRQLLSATASIAGNGVLVVQLDDAGDTVVVQETAAGGNTAAVIDANAGQIGAFTGVNAIVVLGGKGNDSITVQSQNVPLFINGGDGNDLIGVQINPVDIVSGDGVNTPFAYGVFNPTYTGAGSVVLGGNGDDTLIVSGLSNSTVLGGNGNDSIIAGGTIVTFLNSQFQSETDIGGGSQMLIDGDNGDDVVQSGFQQAIAALTDSTLLGGNGSDTIIDSLSNGTNTVDGGNGVDSITVVNGDIVVSSNGHDTVTTI
jgi:Ca2+-binding RTX toxin-like protein